VSSQEEQVSTFLKQSVKAGSTAGGHKKVVKLKKS